MRIDLGGKVAMLVGASGILGPHFATALAAAGADLVLVDLADTTDLADTLARTHGVRTAARTLDLSQPQGFDALLAEVEESIGAVDILHANAASKGPSLESFFAPDETFDLGAWRAVMGVNVDGLAYVTSRTGARMAARGTGSIILTASIYGVTAPDQRIYEGSRYLDRQIRSPAVYSASKAAVAHLARHFATLWGAQGVRVNCIAPGGVESGQNDVFSRNYARRIPLGRMARAEEMTGALLFFASEMSSYVTGQTLVIDGGLTAW